MKKIYIILSQTNTCIGKILKFFTKEKYNHSSLCLKDNFKTFYSFGRKHPYFIIPGGFIIENAFKSTYARFSKIPCMILEKEISDENYSKLERIVTNFIENKRQYSYAFLSVIFTDTEFSITNKNKYFCSQFVAKVLNDINISTPKVPEHMHPFDFTKLSNTKIIYEGDLKEFCKSKN